VLYAISLLYPDALHPADMSRILDAALTLALRTGLLAGGLHISGARWGDRWLAAWAGAAGLTLIAALARNNVSGLQTLAAVAQIGVIIPLAWQARKATSNPPRVWAAAMTLDALCLLAAQIDTAAGLDLTAWQTLIVSLQTHVAHTTAAAALGFWLLYRFSNVTAAWAEPGTVITATMLATAGTLLAIARLNAWEDSLLLRIAGGLAALATPLACMIYAAHGYRGLSDRNPSRTLAAHWFALMLALLLVGVGMLGAILALPAAARSVHGTLLADMPLWAARHAVLALTLGMVNQIAAETRTENRRVTGLLPFWSMAFGWIGAGLALTGAGLVQAYARSVPFEPDLGPLYALHLLGLLGAGFGAVVYALGFWVRRVKG
jgi:hypothetical protein